MRVFVTGATGFVGSAIVEELLRAGYQVLGLVRSEAGETALRKIGAQAHFGRLEDLDRLHAGAAAVDAVIHTAFNHDFSKFAANAADDRRAIEAMGAALEGTDRPLLVTSGLALLVKDRVAVEDDRAQPSSAAYPRASEEAAAALAARGVRAGIVRLSPSVHGPGDHGFVPILIDIARQKGVSAYIGDGANRWPAVHRLDAARLYRLALEKGVEHGPYHAVGEEGVMFKEIAEAIAAELDVPSVSLPREDAGQHFGWFASFAEMNMSASSLKTCRILGWEPSHPTLLDDIKNAGYVRKES